MPATQLRRPPSPPRKGFNHGLLGQARRRAKDVLARLRARRGRHPLLEDPRASPPLANLVESYIAARSHDLAPKTRRDYRGYLKTIRASPLAEIPAELVRRAEVRAFLADVSKRGPAIGNRTWQILRAACRWGLREDILTINPVDAMQRPNRERSRDRVLQDRELGIVGQVLDDQRPEVRGVVLAQLLLAQRPTETRVMRWQDVDLARALWEIPGAHRKGGRPHVIPLSSRAVTLIDQLPRATERVFEGVQRDVSKWWSPLRSAAVGLGCDHFTRHDLRRTAATGIAKHGKASPSFVSRILGHATPQGTVAVTGIYDRYDRLDEARVALEAWGRVVERSS